MDTTAKQYDDLENSPRGCSRMYHIIEVDGKVCVVTGQENVSKELVGKLQIWSLRTRQIKAGARSILFSYHQLIFQDHISSMAARL